MTTRIAPGACVDSRRRPSERPARATPPWLDFLLRATGSPGFRRFSRAALAAYLRCGLRHLPFHRGNFLRRLFLAPPGCCAPDGGVDRLGGHFVNLLASSRAMERVQAWRRNTDPARLAARLEAWSRVALLGTLRHSILRCRSVSYGVPPAVLYHAQLAPYPACSMSCLGCYAAADRSGDAPDRARLAWLVDEIASCGAWVVNIVGSGEPFLSPDQTEDLLAVAADHPHLFFAVATSGVSIDDALARRISEAPNLFVLVSVEGNRRVHDARRGIGAYDMACRAMASLHRRGVSFGFACMVARTNYREVTRPSFARELAEAGCLVGVYSRYFPLVSDGCEVLALRPEDETRYEARLAQVRDDATLPLLDIDELESRSGCRARAPT